MQIPLLLVTVGRKMHNLHLLGTQTWWSPLDDHLNPITTWFVVWISFKHWGNMVFLSLSLSLLILSLLLILLLSWWHCCITFKIFSAHKMHILRQHSNLMRRLLWLQIQFSNIHVPEICRDSRRDLSIFIIPYIQHNTRKDNILVLFNAYNPFLGGDGWWLWW